MGVDSLFGLFISNISAPFSLYASLKGKFQVWDEILGNLPDSLFRDDPALDIGCGRGLVLLKIAERKKKLIADTTNPIPPVYGTDIFRTEDQSGNSPLSTYQNAAAIEVVPYAVLHHASFTEKFPFRNDVFSLVTSNLALHHTNRAGKAAAMREVTRVCKPGGTVVVLNLFGHLKDHRDVLSELGWKEVTLVMVA